jgi:uncharacterized protein (DUF362 family)
MPVPVAIVSIKDDYSAALQQALSLVGGLAGLNTTERAVTIKVGIFDPRSRHHSAPAAVGAICAAFDQAPQVFLAESDNYCGGALERLQQCYGQLFSGRVRPLSLSDSNQFQLCSIAGEDMPLSQALFKPNVFVSTHVLRTFAKGSILKNLFGCTPMVKKARFHKDEVFARLLADIFQAAGGIDLAVMDGAFLFGNASEQRVATDVLIVGRDAVAVETVGAWLAGLKPEKVPVIREFARRGLGAGSLGEIELLGADSVEVARLLEAHKALKRLLKDAPRPPGLAKLIDQLIEQGWFDLPRRSSAVLAELQARGLPDARQTLVETTLKRRAGKTLERVQENGGWVYRKPG